MRSSSRAALTAVTFLVALVLCFPILWTAFTGLKNERDALAVPPTLFVPLTLEHFWQALGGDYLHYFGNTILAVFVSITAAFTLGLPAAYRLAFFPGPKANDILFFALSTRFMPGVAVIVPLFLLYTRLGLIDTMTELVIVYTALNLPIVLWLMRSFSRTCPMNLWRPP